MVVTETSIQESLDHALIQCLRLFAQHGRKIRNHEMIPENKNSDGETILRVSGNIHNDNLIDSEVSHVRQVVE